TYTIPVVHYAPEITLNILSLGLLRQQGFEISSNGDRCTLACMFKDMRGRNINLDKMREQHNNYLEDYFDALDRSANIERKIEQPYEKKDDDVEIGNFHECVAFLDLIRKRGAISNEWEVHRDKFNRVLTWFFNHFLMRPLPGSLPPIIKGVSIHLFDLYELIECMGGYISVQFEDDFERLAEALGLKRSDGLDIRRCYLDYLEPLVSNYKAARSSNPTGGYEDEGIRRFEDYHGDGNEDGSTAERRKEESSISGLPSRKKRKASVTQLHIRIKKTWQGSSAIYVKRRDASTVSAQTKTKDQLMEHQHLDQSRKKILKAFRVVTLRSSLNRTKGEAQGISIKLLITQEGKCWSFKFIKTFMLYFCNLGRPRLIY
nr:ARID DNA-binding domain-containing protein [Tanacetum cinerariifolium]